jgi:medium-chain acyl-[acyl-carrier-protein] hydrolase
MPTPISTPWIKRFKQNPKASLRLFCFPYAGGGATLFRSWHHWLPQQVEVCAIQLPGREDRIKEPPFTQILPLVKVLASILRPYSDIPFAFFGHSVGALISFELAHQLRAQQQPIPIHLFLSARRAPQIPDRNPLLNILPEREFLQELRNLNGTPIGVLENPELLQLVLPLLRADFSICGTYIYQSRSPLSCPISVFGGTGDLHETGNYLKAWDIHTNSTFSLTMIPGNHFFLQTNQSILLELLAQALISNLVQ